MSSCRMIARPKTVFSAAIFLRLTRAIAQVPSLPFNDTVTALMLSGARSARKKQPIIRATVKIGTIPWVVSIRNPATAARSSGDAQSAALRPIMGLATEAGWNPPTSQSRSGVKLSSNLQCGAEVPLWIGVSV